MTPASLEAIAQFRRYMVAERRLSPATDSNYALDLAALVEFCDRQGITRWRRLDTQHVRRFAAHSHARGLSPRSIRRRLSAVRSFYAFLIREHLASLANRSRLPEESLGITSNPAMDVRAPKTQRRLPQTLDVDQMARLLALPDGNQFATRDRAMMELLYSSGLRLAELVGLDVDAVDLREKTVRVLGKGSKTRIVPVGKMAITALKGWLHERPTLAGPGETALFLGRSGTRLSRRAVQVRVALWARRQGVSTRVYPHLFRHSFASHLLESGGELRGVQELLGHADISTTQIYTHLDFQHLARIYDATHPRARKKT
ncbi:MAG TPA: tyrosine recombinase XerC [Steroidobacteraceae bacterium]|nr:tyrosine recombinase XerC [Steroidobacteraceae bacterium]